MSNKQQNCVNVLVLHWQLYVAPSTSCKHFMLSSLIINKNVAGINSSFTELNLGVGWHVKSSENT